MKTIKKTTVAKKPLKKAQAGGTPFQSYLKNNKGASPSDTVAMSIWDRKKQTKTNTTKRPNEGDDRLSIKAKNPKNQKALEKAYEKTYGQDIKTRQSNPGTNETHDQYNRRMGTTSYKKGGATKMQKGGVTFIIGGGPIKKSYKPPLDKKGTEALKKETERRKASAIREAKYRDSLNQIRKAKVERR